MKFVEDRSDGWLITSYGNGWIEIEHKRYTDTVMLTPEGLRSLPDVHTLQDLKADHLNDLLSMELQAVILGSGAQFELADGSLTLPFLQRGIGCDSMDTGSASRTYNVLVAERRKVAGVFIPS